MWYFVGYAFSFGEGSAFIGFTVRHPFKRPSLNMSSHGAASQQSLSLTLADPTEAPVPHTAELCPLGDGAPVH